MTSRANAKFNRHELPATTPDPVYIDHRSLVSIEGVDLATSVGALWDLTSDTSAYIEAVHQLTEDGTVTTQVLKMTSQDGFDAELRLTYVIVVEETCLAASKSSRGQISRWPLRTSIRLLAETSRSDSATTPTALPASG